MNENTQDTSVRGRLHILCLMEQNVCFGQVAWQWKAVALLNKLPKCSLKHTIVRAVKRMFFSSPSSIKEKGGGSGLAMKVVWDCVGRPGIKSPCCTHIGPQMNNTERIT